VVWHQNHSDNFSSVWASKLMVTVSGSLASKPDATVSGGLASKPIMMVSGGLASKPAATVSSGLASKPTATVSGGLASKPTVMGFSGLASKPVVIGFLVEPQNQGGGGFPSLGLKTGDYDLVIWASKSPRRFLGLSLRTKQASVCQLRHKIDVRATAWDTRRDLATCFPWKQVWLGFSSPASRLAEARRRVVHMAPLRRLRRSQVEDGQVDAMGCVGRCYPCFAVFVLLGPRGIVVI
jgi:hypothetical protein